MRLRPRPWLALGWAGLLLLGLSLVQGSTAANSVVESRAGVSYVQSNSEAFAPGACRGMDLSVVLGQSGGGVLRGTPANDLLLGSDKNDRLEGGEGDDCLVAGVGSNDRLYGGPGYDVCVANSRTRFYECEVEIRGLASLPPLLFGDPVPANDSSTLDEIEDVGGGGDGSDTRSQSETPAVEIPVEATAAPAESSAASPVTDVTSLPVDPSAQ